MKTLGNRSLGARQPIFGPHFLWVAIVLGVGAECAQPDVADAGRLRAATTVYTVEPFTIDAGGGYSSGGLFSAEGTIGQADADPLQPAGGGVYQVSGGFWPAALTQGDRVFANGFE